jgi:hypothetical protein
MVTISSGAFLHYWKTNPFCYNELQRLFRVSIVFGTGSVRVIANTTQGITIHTHT